MDHGKPATILIKAALAALAGCALAGCPGWPTPPPLEPEEVWPEPLAEAQTLVVEQGVWLPRSSFSAFKEARGGVVRESPWMTFILRGGTELGRERVTVEIGTDSSRIKRMPEHGCFEGLVREKLIPLFADGPPERGCGERGYGLFRSCPTDPANRLPIYIGAYSLHDDKGHLLEERTLVTMDQVTSPNKRPQPLSVICHKQRWATSFPVPVSVIQNGQLRMRLRLKLILDARRAVGAEDELTYLRIQAVNR